MPRRFGSAHTVSTICLTPALRDNSGGRLIISEFEPSKVTRAQENLDAAGLAELVRFREG